MKLIISPQWQAFLQANGLDSYQKLWELSGEWVEPPNHRRGGWSGVCRTELPAPQGGFTGVYLKRQENHGHRTLMHPIRGEATFVREFKMISHLREHDVPTLNLLCFAESYENGKSQALLMTESLLGYRAMEEILYEGEAVAMGLAKRRRLLKSIACTVRKMHDAGIQHRCLYPKHLMVKEGEGFEVALIDLEKARRVFFPVLPAFRDLVTLNRHSMGLSRSDRLYFFREYLQGSSLRPAMHWLARKIDQRSMTRVHGTKKVHGGKVIA